MFIFFEIEKPNLDIDRTGDDDVFEENNDEDDQEEEKSSETNSVKPTTSRKALNSDSE